MSAEKLKKKNPRAPKLEDSNSDYNLNSDYSTLLSQQLSLSSLELLTHPQKNGRGIEASQKHSNKEGDACDLLWPNINLDRQIFKSALDLLSISNCFRDETFLKEILPAIKTLVNNTQLFKLLADPEIILTKAHQQNGLNSAEHIFKVLEGIPTEHLDDKHKLLLRVFALHHDLGKAISAGLSKEEVKKALSHQAHQDTRDNQGLLKDSFPDHQLTSALLFLSLYEGRANQLKSELIGEEEIKKIAYLIANHHSFYNFTLDENEARFKNWRESLPGNKTQQELLLAYFFIFTYADIKATPAHQKWIKPCVLWMKNTLTNLATLPKNVRRQIDQVISQEITDNKFDDKN
jgi:hypothetical protein